LNDPTRAALGRVHFLSNNKTPFIVLKGGSQIGLCSNKKTTTQEAMELPNYQTCLKEKRNQEHLVGVLISSHEKKTSQPPKLGLLSPLGPYVIEVFIIFPFFFIARILNSYAMVILF
jgi:hypothetical protein